MYKVLYVCPFAHYSGHHPHVAMIEPEALKKAGNEVTLLTFCGIIDDQPARVKFLTVIPRQWKLIRKILHQIRQVTLLRWFLMLFETYATLDYGIRLYIKDKYDVIHLRDGDPFLFMPFLTSIIFDKVRWAISVTGSVIYAPKTTAKEWIKKPFLSIYSLALAFVRGKIWQPIYDLIMLKDDVIIMPQNERATEAFRGYLNGVFKEHIQCVARGTGESIVPLEQSRARERLRVPQNSFVLLSFGAPHQGKSMETIFEAMVKLPDIFLVHGGMHNYSLGGSPAELAKKYQVDNRAKIYDYFIPEEDKPVFFGCANALVLSYTKIFASTSSMLGEAAKFGIPVIASSNHPLCDEVLKYDMGLIFEAENPYSLAKAIQQFLLLDNQQLATMKQGSYRFLAEHSLDKWAKDCDKVYTMLNYKRGKKVESNKQIAQTK